ncbi:MAG TPA: hypothetical protein VLX09_11705 [Stellaceae bacterium]|nr:hypothetical protein [Stellaceae bacterium]
MLTIQWINASKQNPNELIEQLVFPRDTLPDAMSLARNMLAATQARHPQSPPNGFRILDGQGRAVGRHVLSGDANT